MSEPKVVCVEGREAHLFIGWLTTNSPAGADMLRRVRAEAVRKAEAANQDPYPDCEPGQIKPDEFTDELLTEAVQELIDDLSEAEQVSETYHESDWSGTEEELFAALLRHSLGQVGARSVASVLQDLYGDDLSGIPDEAAAASTASVTG